MADAPKLQGTEKIGESYYKINMGIDNANEALSRSRNAESSSSNAINIANNAVSTATNIANGAVNTANKAEKKANSVQSQLDSIVLENGQSDAEVVQARGSHNLLHSRFDDIESSLEQNAKPLWLVNGTDCTSIIQGALNSKGHIKIVSPGTFLTGCLEIPSDTTFELADGVVLKKKDGTNRELIVNKGHRTNTRDKNIKLIGGTFDLNKAGNPQANGNYDANPQSWPGIGIVFRGVDNLSIENVRDIGNEWKYCYLITNVSDFKGKNIRMNNGSDGLHFQPPLTNVNLENITGNTDDDLISFTMGDYTNYTLGKTGNVENVYINKVHSNGSDQVLKLVGSGINGASKFKNITLENVTGITKFGVVSILKEDLADGNKYLKDTKLENINFNNINVEFSQSNGQYFDIGAVEGDISISNINVNPNNILRVLNVLKGSALQKLTLNNITMKSITTVTNNISSLFRFDGKVDDVFGDNMVIDYEGPTTYGFYATDNSVKNLHLSNIQYRVNNSNNFVFGFDGISNDKSNINVSNSKLKGGTLIHSTTLLEMNLSTVNLELISNRLAIMTATTDIKINAENTFSLNPVTANWTTDGRKICINSRTLEYNGRLQDTNPQEGTYLKCASDLQLEGKGLYYYSNSKWYKPPSVIGRDYSTNYTVPVDGFEGYTQDIGFCKRLVSNVSSLSLNAGEVRTVTVQFKENILNEDIISANIFTDKKVAVLNTYPNTSDRTKVFLVLENKEASLTTISTIKVTVIQFRFTHS
ncbi:hypothetical protein [Bacillus cereus]|uniref:hypothetical protein n=1 Tax=Bacillus cereus TaxID=1396 RepID=UPI000279AE67|nr:hypothetical protein [Bacillus cereus]EJR71347.1 hypothetical protein IK9_05998 [Bacillus cereus VD166]